MGRVAGQSIQKPAVIALCALVGVLLGLGGFTFVYAKGYSYMLNDPKVCVNCHIMREQYDGWQQASHHAAAVCNDCHIPHTSVLAKYWTKAENGFWHSKGFTFQDFHEPIRIRPRNARALNQNCRRCHGEFVAGILAHQENKADELYCVRCHADVGHGPSQ